MSERVSQDLVQQFCVELGAHFGLDLTEQHRPGLSQRMERLCRQKDWEPWPACADWILRHLHHLEVRSALLQEITVGETYFYRETQGLLQAVKHIEAVVQRKQGEFPWARVWCAGCSNGEEPYTLAAMLSEQLLSLPAEAVEIMASDVNPAALERAMQGVYGEWSFRAAPPGFKARYFEKAGQKYRLGRRTHPGQDLRRRVQFREINLATTPFPPDYYSTARFDVILCRNVLMYLQPHVVDRCMAGFHRSLSPDGLLMLGVTEQFRESEPARHDAPAQVPFYIDEPAAAVADSGAEIAELASPSVAVAPRGDESSVSDLEAQYEQACKLREAGDLQASVSVFRRVLYLEANHLPSHVALGGIFRELGFEQLSQRHWATAARLMGRQKGDSLHVGEDTLYADKVAAIAPSLPRERH